MFRRNRKVAQAADLDAETPVPAEEIVQVAGWRLAVALTWTGAQSAAEARRFAGKNNAYVVCDAGGEIAVARGSKAAVGLLAGGALVGRLMPDAFVYHRLSDDRYWICLIRDGVPYPDYDRVVSGQQANQLYTNASSMAAPGTRLIGDIAPSTQTLAEVLQHAQALSRKELDECRLRKNGIRHRTVVISACVVAALATTAQLAIEHRDKLLSERKRQDMLRALLQSQQQREAESARIAKAVRDFQAKVAEQRALFRTPNAAWQQWTQCETQRHRLPFTHSGYRPVKLTCDFTGGVATVEWQAVGPHTRISDRAYLPGIVDPLDVGNHIVSSFVLPPLPAIDASAREVSLKQVRMDLVDWAHAKLSGGIRLAAEETVTLQPPAEIKGLDHVDSVTLGSRVLLDISATTSKDVLMLPEAMRYLSAWPISFQKMVWSSPTAPGAQFSGASTLFIPQ